MNAEDVKVRRWSFCPECKGVGCAKCRNGVVVELVLLKDIPRIHRDIYVRAQKDFIKEQVK